MVMVMMMVVGMIVMVLSSEHSCPWLRCSCAYSNGDVDGEDGDDGYTDGVDIDSDDIEH